MYNTLLLPDLRLMLEENDVTSLAEFCNALYPAVVAEVLNELDTIEVWRVLENCSLERQSEIMQFLSLPKQAELVQDLDRNRLSRLLEIMSPDDRVDLLSRLDEDRVESLMPLIAQVERADIRKLLSYPEHSAGAIMTTDYASLTENITVGEALERLRKQAPDSETIYYIFILDEGRRLHGIITLRQLILARPSTILSDIMSHDVISVRVDDDQEIVAQMLAKYDFIAIPVVDNQNRLVGIVTHDDILDVVQEEANEDAFRLAAVEPMEDGYLSTPAIRIAWNRGIWLFILMVTGLATAGVLDYYKQVSDSFKWMMAFIPLILASGGNAGSQSATLVIRTIAMDALSKDDRRFLIFREIGLASLLGFGMTLLAGIFVIVIFKLTAMQSLVVCLTVFLVVMMGTVSGAVLPLLFKHLGMDPALMSNPLIAALVDVLGVVIYYNVAIMLLI